VYPASSHHQPHDRHPHLGAVEKHHPRPIKPSLFAGLDENALRQIFSAGRVRVIEPKKNVMIKGARPDHLFLLERGRARSYMLTECGEEVLLLWVVPGVVLGLVCLLANAPNYMTNATTVTECAFRVWDHRTIYRLTKIYPQLIENSFRLALHYLKGYMGRHAAIMTKSAASRLADTLLHLAADAGHVQPSGIAIDITNEQLGSLADISFFTASRILSKWEEDRKIYKERGRVTLLAPEALMVA
jgi:CRP-like cAMP-binding protein